MEYIQITFNLENTEEFISDLLPTYLAEIGFDSFDEATQGINAYCPSTLFSETEMINVLHSLPCYVDNISYTIETIEDTNWNATWEAESFRPIEINENCCVRPTNIETDKTYQYNIIINPTQSFGTGYHETTRMVMNAMFEYSPKGLDVLDMGCGTAVLSILASMLGAKHITAIDVDTWSYNNSRSNVELNNINNIEVHLGNAETLNSIEHNFDMILANINRNILLADMDKYVSKIKHNALIIFSGFYQEDYPIIERKAIELGLSAENKYSDNNWQCAIFRRK